MTKSSKSEEKTERRFYDNGKMSFEKLPDGTVREWFGDGQISHEKFPDGTETKYDFNGEVRYHATKGVEDTKDYRVKQRVETKRQQVLNKLEGKPALQKAVEKVADSKTFKKIATTEAKLAETVTEKSKSIKRAQLLKKNHRDRMADR